MDIFNIIDLIVNNSIGVVCLAYFIVRDYMFISKIEKTLDEIMERL